MKRRPGAHTLLELLVVCGLLLLLTGLCFGAWRVGVTSFSKVDRKTKLLTDLQVISVLLRKESSFANRSSFSLVDNATHSAIGFLSARTARDAGDSFTVDGARFRPSWQKYLVIYLDKAGQELYLREVPLAAGASQQRFPTPIERYSAGAGAMPLSDYCEEGRRVATGLAVMRCRWEENGLRVSLEAVGSERTALEEERLEVEVVLQPRN